jgi:MFS family permease
MTSYSTDLTRAFDEVSASSMGGAPFLIAYGATFLLTAILSFFIPRTTAALIALFQGGLALPIAFWLERKMSKKRMAPDNPLRSLSVQMSMSQALGLPALILVYSLNPLGIPLALASLGGIHFLPYAWLHRTRIYVYFAIAVAVGAFAIQVWLAKNAFSYILLYIAVAYWITMPFVYMHAKKLIKDNA